MAEQITADGMPAQTAAGPALEVDDLTVTVAGQGGDGSLTIIALLSLALSRRGLYLYRSSNIASRIKGGHAAATLRASTVPRGALGDHIHILVAFDAEAIEKIGRQLASDGVVIFDSSRGPLPAGYLPETARVVPVPFSRLAVRDLRRDLFKNSLGFGILARIIGLEDEEARECLRRRFHRQNQASIDANLNAMERGLTHATETGIAEASGWLRFPALDAVDRPMLTGNEGIALGFLAAGGLFYAGYPITPATTLLETLGRHLPRLGGVVIQGEDELAAINYAIGAALTGARAMVGSSGPGIALMQESVGHCASAEIPLVVVDCQRAGPSTGMPTKLEQSDIDMLVHGANGDFPRIVLYPGDPAECFRLGALATNLAQQIQGPVYLTIDSMAADAMSIDGLDLDSVTIEPGKRLDGEALSGLTAYQRYAVTQDGISPWVVPGTPGGMNLVTGNERDEWGRVSTVPAIRTMMMDKRARKVDAVMERLPQAEEQGADNAEIGIISLGGVSPVVEEACEILQRDHGLKTRRQRPRTLWPVLEDTLAFTHRYQCVYVVEQNESGQYRRLLQSAGAPAENLRSIRNYDGTPFRPALLAAAILMEEEGHD